MRTNGRPASRSIDKLQLKNAILCYICAGSVEKLVDTSVISCQKGYQFPDKTSAANLICRDCVWVPTRPELSALPDCEAVCEPTCMNGGKCFAPNMWQCSFLYCGFYVNTVSYIHFFFAMLFKTLSNSMLYRH